MHFFSKYKLVFFTSILFLLGRTGFVFTQTTVTYTATGTFVVPFGVGSVMVECWGSGGGGGSSANGTVNGGAAGGGGAYSKAYIAVTPLSTTYITVGLGGAGGPGSSTTAPEPGNDSWFNNTINAVPGSLAEGVLAKGGSAGINNWTGASPAGGASASCIGTTVFSGGNGGTGNASSGGGGGASAGTGAVGGNGGAGGGGGACGTAGAAPAGGGAGGQGGGLASCGHADGNPGVIPGGAGGGSDDVATAAGGNGARGEVKITYCIGLSGSYTIGGGGSPDFATLTAAFAQITLCGISGNVNLVLQSGYSSAGETFPLVPSTNTGAYTVTIYPAVSGLSITSANATGTLNLDGGKNYVFDGRVNGVGSTKDLIIANTVVTGYAVQFINDATSNTIKYCDVQGVNTSATEGVVMFSTTTATSGNDNNTIDNCNIHEGASTPANCVYSLGTAAKENSNNTISNNNIYNFFITASTARGILISSNSTAWTISGNSFYQTATRNGGFRIIDIVNTSGVGFNVSNNYLGGSAALAGGSAFTVSSTTPYVFYVIYMNVGSSPSSTIANNTIKNINYTADAANGVNFIGVWVAAGTVDVNANVMGDNSTGSITVNINISGANISQNLFLAHRANGSVTNNILGSITVGGTTNKERDTWGIYCDGARTSDFYVTGNTVGNASTANSINLLLGAVPPSYFNGIQTGTTGNVNIIISNNLIANITDASTNNSTSCLIYGINSTDAGNVTTEYNTVHNLTTATTNKTAKGGTNYLAFIGIGCADGGSVNNNTIYNLKLTSLAVQPLTYGIFVSGGTGNVVSKNLLYNFESAADATIINGIGIANAGVTANVSNNIIRLGYKTDGTSSTFASYYTGIMKQSSGACNFYYNSVYIGGTGVNNVVANYTSCFEREVTAADDFRDNILYNTRANAGAGANHYAIVINLTTTFTSNNNVLLTSTAANLGSYNAGTTPRDFTAWKAGIIAPQDAASLNSDPLFIDPTALTPNLHCLVTSPAKNAATVNGGITTDIDNDSRDATPDIGADEICGGGFAGGGAYAIYAADGAATVTDCELIINSGATCGPTPCRVCTPTDDSYSSVGISGFTVINAGDATNANTNCTGINMNMTTAAPSPDWTGSAAPLTGPGSPKTVAYTSTGRKTVSLVPADLLITQGFNASTIPAGWAETMVVDPGTNPDLTFVLTNPNTNPATAGPAEGTYYVHFNSFTCPATASVRLSQTASFSTVGKSNITVKFYWHEDNGYPAAADGVTVQWSTDGAAWNNSTVYPRYNAAETAAGSWHAKSTVLPAGAAGQATLYIAFLFTSQYGNNCDFDGLTVIAGGGTYTDFNNILMAPPSQGTVTGINTLCPGTSNYASSEAGTPGFTYLWTAGTVGGETPTIATSTLSATNITFANSDVINKVYPVYLQITSGCCGNLPLITYDVTVYPDPNAPTVSGSPYSKCTGGSVTLAVSAPDPVAGYNYNWYNAASGGTLYGAGSSYIVNPVLSGATNYYAEAIDANGCKSPTRTTVTVNGTNTPPVAPGSPFQRCAPGVINISVTPTAGYTYDFYSGSCGGTLLQSGAGNSYNVNVPTSPTIVNTYVRQTAPGCTVSSCVTVVAQTTGSGAATTTWNGSVDTDWYRDANWSACVPSALVDAVFPAAGVTFQCTINFSSAFNTTFANAKAKSITINAGRILTLLNNLVILEVNGNWSNSGSFVPNTGRVEFKGAVAQGITGATSFYNLSINNSSTGVSLNSATTVSNNLALTSGALKLNSNTLTVTNPAITAINRTSGYLVSELNAANNTSKLQWNIGATTGAHIFPFGTNSGDYIPVTFNNSGASGNVTISTRPSPNNGTLWAAASNVAAVNSMSGVGDELTSAIDRWWDITSSVASPLPAVNLTLSYLGTENTMTSVPDRTTELGIQHWNGSSWDNGKNGGEGSVTLTGTNGVTTGVGSITATGLTYFSPYAIVKGSKPLPIDILSFSAYPEHGIVKLIWSTATEVNNAYFTIERSKFGNEFESIGKVNSLAPGGNSSVQLDYNSSDENPFQGVSYYRLKQTDLDGMFSYSDVVAVNLKENSSHQLYVFPNPANDKLNIVIGEIENAKIKIYDVTGQVVSDADICNLRSVICNVDISSLANGVYFVSLSDGENTRYARFVKD